MPDINIGALSEAINDKMDRDLNNRSTDSGLRKLVESYVNGASWYKVFDEIQSDGTVKQWCEQGGYSTGTVTFLKVMIDTNYTITSGDYRNGASTSGDYRYITAFSTTGFTKAVDSNGSFWWKVEGYIS